MLAISIGGAGCNRFHFEMGQLSATLFDSVLKALPDGDRYSSVLRAMPSVAGSAPPSSPSAVILIP